MLDLTDFTVNFFLYSRCSFQAFAATLSALITFMFTDRIGIAVKKRNFKHSKERINEKYLFFFYV